MENFMSRYLNGELKKEEIKKHGLTKEDLLYMEKQYQEIKIMYEKFQTSIFDKKEQSEKIKEELENGQKIANLLSSLGKAYENFITGVELGVSSCVDDTANPLDSCLWRNLDQYYYSTIKFIIYLLSRQHRNYQLCRILTSVYTDFGDALNWGLGDASVLTSEEDLPYEFQNPSKILNIDHCKAYINKLYKSGKSFILTVHHDHKYGDFHYNELYAENKVLYNSKKVSILGHCCCRYHGRYYTNICFLGDDDVFRDVMTKLMLFSQLHGFCVRDIGTGKGKMKEDYAQAVESMDISSYSMEINKRIWPNQFTLSRKKQNNGK